MKALTLTQPWATLVQLGVKGIETRSWSTPYRGPLAIHASARWAASDRLLCPTEPFRSALVEAGYLDPSRLDYRALDRLLPFGCVLAIVDLVEVVCITDRKQYPGEPERSFGFYALGRKMWRLANVRTLDEPIPARGALGLWEWTPPADLTW